GGGRPPRRPPRWPPVADGRLHGRADRSQRARRPAAAWRPESGSLGWVCGAAARGAAAEGRARRAGEATRAPAGAEAGRGGRGAGGPHPREAEAAGAEARGKAARAAETGGEAAGVQTRTEAARATEGGGEEAGATGAETRAEAAQAAAGEGPRAAEGDGGQARRPRGQGRGRAARCLRRRRRALAPAHRGRPRRQRRRLGPDRQRRRGEGRRRPARRPRVHRLPPAGHQHDQGAVDERHRTPGPGRGGAFRDRARRPGEQRPARAELRQPGLRRLHHARRPARGPPAAAAGALRERVPRVRGRVPLRGEWRAGGRMTTRRGVAAFGVLVLALGRASPAAAVVTGQIFGPGSESFPIAVVPLKNLGGDTGGELGTRFAQVLSRDLDLSGYFRLLDPKTFIENPQTSGVTAGEIDFVGWAALGAQALVKGGVTTSGDTGTVEF